MYLLIFLLVIIIFYLYSIKPNKKRKMDFLLNRFYAHRGVHNNKGRNPENSLASFAIAAKENFGIELDVQVTKDNIPVVFHDKTLLRACSLRDSINNLLFLDLKRLRLFNTSEHIPSLKEVLELIDGKVPLIVEIKNETSDISEIQYIASVLDNYKGDYAVESFNPLVVMWYKKNRPHIIRGQLSTYFKKSSNNITKSIRNFFLENLMTNFITKPDFIAFNYKYKDMFSFKLCKKLYNPLTAAYTIKSREKMIKNSDDFDLIIFDSFIPNKKSANS